MQVYQKSNITPSEITLEHTARDTFGLGGDGASHFEVKFSLLEDTRITVYGREAWRQFAVVGVTWALFLGGAAGWAPSLANRTPFRL